MPYYEDRHLKWFWSGRDFCNILISGWIATPVAQTHDPKDRLLTFPSLSWSVTYPSPTSETRVFKISLIPRQGTPTALALLHHKWSFNQLDYAALIKSRSASVYDKKSGHLTFTDHANLKADLVCLTGAIEGCCRIFTYFSVVRWQHMIRELNQTNGGVFDERRIQATQVVMYHVIHFCSHLKSSQTVFKVWYKRPFHTQDHEYIGTQIWTFAMY